MKSNDETVARCIVFQPNCVKQAILKKLKDKLKNIVPPGVVRLKYPKIKPAASFVRSRAPKLNVCPSPSLPSLFSLLPLLTLFPKNFQHSECHTMLAVKHGKPAHTTKFGIHANKLYSLLTVPVSIPFINHIGIKRKQRLSQDKAYKI